MSIIGSVVVFLVTWMLVLFMVLPWGVRPQGEEDEPIVPGTAESAPVKPKIWTRFAITTLVTCIIFAAIWVAVDLDVFDLRAYFQAR
ncbi:DUF1467 family protein [Sneathiella sp.]|uniref:DUF1467 family protein n=1 Tax=Sneathiella sp. TaxID=1964365 RepID=UPI002FE08F59